MKRESGPVCLWFVRCGLLVLTLTAMLLRAQEPPQPDETGAAPADGPPVTVHGVIVNATTGNPLSGALVKIDNQQLGARSDREGRFSIAGVPSGLQSFEVIKPGFHPPGKSSEREVATTHSVRVTANTPGLSFSLAPDNSISGHIMLAPGVTAKRIGIVLLEQFNSNGRPAWLSSDTHESTPAGEFRFYGLRDGTYLLMTKPEFENAPVGEPFCNADSPGEMDGYDSIFYHASGSLESAARIVVSGGQNAEADLSVTMTKFHLAQVSIQNAPTGDSWTFNDELFDHDGHEVQYPIHEEKNHTLCAYLPDGAYTLVEDVTPGEEGARPQGTDSLDRVGTLEFRLDRHAQRDLRIKLSQGTSTPIYLHYQPGPPKPSEQPKPSPNEPLREFEPEPLRNLDASRSNGFSDSNSTDLGANRINDTTYAFGPSPPGAYWLHAAVGMPGTCLGQVTAAGQDLGQSQWMVGPAGTGTPIDIVLRTDCATLTFYMPPTLPEESTGEGASIYIYAVPAFSSVADMLSAQLEQYGNRSEKLEGITPGTYRVFAFHTPHSLEYHNLAALGQTGTGKEITVDAGGSATLVVEEIAP